MTIEQILREALEHDRTVSRIVPVDKRVDIEALAQQIRDSLKHVCEWEFERMIADEYIFRTSCGAQIALMYSKISKTIYRHCHRCGGTIKQVGK